MHIRQSTWRNGKPGLIARAWDRSLDDAPFAGLVTAPSNTAIDELLTGAAALFSECEAFDSSDLLNSIEIVRIASDKPDDPPDPVTYVDYNDSADAGTFVRLKERLRQATQSDQETLAEFSDAEDSSATQTLVFATPTGGRRNRFRGPRP